MAGLVPVVRYLIVCEDVVVDPHNANRINLLNLITYISGDSGFPLYLPELCVYLQVRGSRGPGNAQIRVVLADTEEIAFSTSVRRLGLGTDPLELVGFSFRIRNCPFPTAGMYYVQFWYNEEMVAQEFLIVG